MARSIECDPVTGDRYRALPWRQIGLDQVAPSQRRKTVAITHFMIVERSFSGQTVAERLSLLAAAIADVYNGLEFRDGEALAVGWRTLLADLATCSVEARAGWVALYGESTGNWWPPRSEPTTRGVVNAVLRSPEVETFHTSDRVTFYDNQLGTFCANWAAGSLLDEVLDLDDPDSWGLEQADFARAADGPRFTDGLTRFPVAAALVAAAGRCSIGGTRREDLALPSDGTTAEAMDWLAVHAGPATPEGDQGRDVGVCELGQQHTTVRDAWTSPLPSELDRIHGNILVVPTLTRLSRDPRHLAAALQWATRSDVPVLSPNVLIEADAVNIRHPLQAAPSADVKPSSNQATHEASWTNPTGLSDRHATLLRELFPAEPGTPAPEILTSARSAKLGRNELCWCGSGKKYKRCHLEHDS